MATGGRAWLCPCHIWIWCVPLSAGEKDPPGVCRLARSASPIGAAQAFPSHGSIEMMAQWSWDIQDVTTLVSLAAGLVSIVQLGRERYRTWRDTREAARSLEEEAAEAALN